VKFVVAQFIGLLFLDVIFQFIELIYLRLLRPDIIGTRNDRFVLARSPDLAKTFGDRFGKPDLTLFIMLR